MKIAQVTATFPPYMAGTGNICYYQAMELARRGHQVSVYTAAGPSRDKFDPPGVDVRRLQPLIRFGNAPFLPGLLQIRDADIVHLHYPFIFGAELIWMASKIHRIPFVLTYHNDLVGEGVRRSFFAAYSSLTAGPVFRAAEKLAVVSVDHAMSSRMAPIFQSRCNDVLEIPNGVDAELFHPLPEDSVGSRRFGISADDRLILFVGALDRAHYFKGVSVLLEAVAKLRDQKVVLLIIGDGDRKADYQRQAEKLGIGQRTVFAGCIPFPELPRYYSSADLLILPSVKIESFGIVLIEAMACQTPVIASDLPGLRSVVTDGKEGLLVTPADSDALAEKIHFLLGNPGLCREMGMRGRAKVETKYAWPKVIPLLIRMYEQVLAGRGLSVSEGK